MAQKKTGMDEAMVKVDSVAIGSVQDAALNPAFSIWSTLGSAFSFIATPLSVGSYLAFSLSAGGSPYFFYGFLCSFIFNTLVALSLAEMAGFLPHTSGQIFWTAKLAPPRYARTLSYFNGGFTMMAWLFWTAGTCLFSAQLLAAFVSVCGSSWKPQDYQEFLMYTAFAIWAFLMNTAGFKAMPSICKFMIGYINIGSLFVLIALLVRSQPKQSAKQVFVDVINETGWTSNGVVFFLALLPGVTAINGFDSAAHLADELPHPAHQVPKVMIGTVLLCGFAGLPMVVTFLFSITEPGKLLTSPQPIFQLFLDSMNSQSITIIACIIYLGLFTFACSSILTTLSRCWWAFARSGALPMSQWQSHISIQWELPINALLVTTVIEILIGLLIFGPATILTGLVGSAAICFYFSYLMPIACLLWRGRNSLPERRYFSLGRAGPIINVVALVWACLVSGFLCFPTYLPVTSNLMNYACAVVGVGTFMWVLNWYFYASTHYEVPVALYAEEIHGSRQSGPS